MLVLRAAESRRIVSVLCRGQVRVLVRLSPCLSSRSARSTFDEDIAYGTGAEKGKNTRGSSLK